MLSKVMFAGDVQAIANTVRLATNQNTRKGNICHVHYSKKYINDGVLINLAKDGIQVRFR